MEYLNLGKTGLKVSRICLGWVTYGAPATGELKGGSHAWALNEEESQPYLRQALDLGINAISAPLWRRARTEESRLGDSIQRFGRRSSRSHEPAGERFDGGAPNRLDKDNWTGYQPQRPIHRRASLRLKDYLERYTQRFR